jgi:hypothetical protein
MDKFDFDIDFQWWRCLDGYRLDRSGLTSASSRFELYRPLQITGLFAIFAKDTNRTPEGMQKFCSRFGLLGSGRFDVSRGTESKPTHESVVLRELLVHHSRMQSALQLFERGDHAEFTERWNHSQGLGWLRVDLRCDLDGQFGMVFVPPDLIRAMWFQFVKFACSGAQLFRCERCNNPFPVGTGTGRRNTSKYCSNACKVAAFKIRSPSPLGGSRRRAGRGAPQRIHRGP